MADLREDFVQYVVKALVSNPDAVELKRLTDDKGEYLELTVEASDMGKVIGKAGATAKSIRTLLRGIGAKDNLTPLPLKIVDPQGDQAAVVDTAGNVEPMVSDGATEPAAETEPAPSAEAPESEPQQPEGDDLRERTKREIQDFADFDL